jgi:hypothetical protein
MPLNEGLNSMPLLHATTTDLFMPLSQCEVGYLSYWAYAEAMRSRK